MKSGTLGAQQVDVELLRACQGGDRQAFRVLFEVYRDRVYSIALHFSSSRRSCLCRYRVRRRRRRQDRWPPPPRLVRRSRRSPDGRAGAPVGRVDEGTVTAQAGLRRGDLILRVNGALLASPLAYDRAFVALRGGDTARLEILRDGQTFERTVTLPPMPLETFPGIDVTYDSVLPENGLRFRTIITRPKNATGRLPGLFLAGWLSCDSVEVPVGPKGGIEKLLDVLITQSGFVVMRMDKPGVGDSEGHCSQADFQAELAG